MSTYKVNSLLEKLEQTHNIDKEGLILLLNSPSSPIGEAADRVRKNQVGDFVHLRGLIEYSNYCYRTCFYCGLRGLNQEVNRYRMTPDEILEAARHAKSLGLKTIVLQGGEDRNYPIKDLYHVIENIKKMDVAITLSLGEYPREVYKEFKSAGADRYLLRIETTNADLYQKLHPNMEFENRLRCLWNLRELGYEVGTGCLVGLPGQTIDMLADDLLFFKKLNADMIGIGPFIPSPHTPLASSTGGDMDTTLKVVALTRLLLPDINIPATTAVATKFQGYDRALSFGTNVIMPNVGFDQYKKLYNLYPGKVHHHAKAEDELNRIKNIITKAGRTIGTTKGFRGGLNFKQI